MPDRLYGFRPKQRPQYQGADAVVNPVDPRVPRPIGSPPAPTSPLASASDTRINDYSGTSAEGDGSIHLTMELLIQTKLVMLVSKKQLIMVRLD